MRIFGWIFGWIIIFSYLCNITVRLSTMRFRQHTKLSALYDSGRCSVVIRVSSQGKRKDLYTGITVKPSQWNGSKERVKQGCTVDGLKYNVLNDKLEKMEKFVDDYFNGSALRSVDSN